MKSNFKCSTYEKHWKRMWLHFSIFFFTFLTTKYCPFVVYKHRYAQDRLVHIQYRFYIGSGTSIAQGRWGDRRGTPQAPPPPPPCWLVPESLFSQTFTMIRPRFQSSKGLLTKWVVGRTIVFRETSAIVYWIKVKLWNNYWIN